MSRAPLLDETTTKEQYRDDHSDVESARESSLEYLQPKRSSGLRLTIQAFALVAGFGFAALCGYYLPQMFWNTSPIGSTSSSSCRDPVVRYEWRSLSKQEQTNYIDAVECLSQQPSRLGLNQSLYLDFPSTHINIGGYSHHAAAFLAWHRYFLHTYEQALQTECGYEGHMTYWDWSLDWEDLTQAPIWSSETFGSNGDPAVGEEYLSGHCVVDGRFAHLKIPFLRDKVIPHCLSRGFASGEELRNNGTACRPAEIEKLMQEDNYEDFFLALEAGPHDSVPHIIRGDFSVLTAPSDPVFFLHHTQLDRIWSMWQERDPTNRRHQYNGAAEHESDRQGSPEDSIPMGGLAPDVTVGDILDTQGETLCYRY